MSDNFSTLAEVLGLVIHSGHLLYTISGYTKWHLTTPMNTVPMLKPWEVSSKSHFPLFHWIIDKNTNIPYGKKRLR